MSKVFITSTLGPYSFNAHGRSNSNQIRKCYNEIEIMSVLKYIKTKQVRINQRHLIIKLLMNDYSSFSTCREYKQ